MSELLNQAVNQIRAGNSQEGKRLLKKVLQSDPHNEAAWMWLSGLVETDHDREACMKRVLLINPNNQHAQRGLATLKARQPGTSTAPENGTGSKGPQNLTLDAQPEQPAPATTPTLKPGASFDSNSSRLQAPPPQADVPQAEPTLVLDDTDEPDSRTLSDDDELDTPPQTTSHSGYYDLFISYSRRDKPFVQKLYESLLKQGREVWVDWGNIPLTADWRNEIKEGIERANAVVFVMSPNFLISEECTNELELAEDSNKRLIPMVCRDVPPEQVPQSLASLNWIFARHNDNFEAGIEALQEALDTDLEWVKVHTRLLVRAKEWETNNRNKSFLLRGDDLNRAEIQIAQAEKNPAPTPLQKQYVLASRQNASARQRAFLVRTAIGLVISIILAITAFVQRQRAVTATELAEEKRILAEQEAQIALSRLLGSLAIIHADDDPSLAALLSLKANQLDLRHDGVFSSKLISSLRHSTFLVTTLHGHTANVRSIDFSPDGQMLASGGKDKSIILWDMNSWQPIGQPLTGHTDRVTQVVFSPDGKTLASSGRDGTIILWNVASGQPLTEPIAAHQGWANSVAFSPTGEILVSTGDDGNIIFWDTATWQPIQTIAAHSVPVHQVVFSPDGSMLASGGDDNTIILWNSITYQAIGSPLTGHTAKINDLAFSPDSKSLASASADHTVRLWDTQTGQLLGPPLTGHLTSVTAVTFSPSGHRIITGSEDDTLISWDTHTLRQLGWPLIGHSNSVLDVAFSPDGKTLASASSDTKIVLFDITAGQTLVGHDSVVRGVAFSPDGQTIASGSDDNTVRQWSTSNRGEWELFSAAGNAAANGTYLHDSTVWHVAYSPNGQRVASTSQDGTIVIWDNASRTPVMPPLAQHEGSIFAAVFSPDGNILASGGEDKTIILWDAATGEIKMRWAAHTDAINGLSFSPDGRTLASASSDDTVRLWDAATGQPLGEPLIGHIDDVNSVDFSPDGSTLASGSSDNLIILWDVPSRQETARLHGHINRVTSVAFSPDGKTLASGSYDKSIILWDMVSKLPVGPPLRDHTNDVNSIAWSPDGKYLVSGSWDTTLTLWEIDLTPWSERACQIANRNLTKHEWDEFIGASFEYHALCPQFPLE